MCFSATASFIAGGGLSAAGVATIRQAKTKRRLPFAAIPLLFGMQQAVEGVVWVSTGIAWLQATAAYIYVMFSHVLWPTYLPLAVMALEPPGRRESVLKGFVVFGVSVSVWLLYFIVQAPVIATLTATGVVYGMNVPDIPYGLAAYVFVTCFTCFISSHKFVRVFGIALIGSLAIALWAYQESFYSVWCFFAAILSFVIYVHLVVTKEGVMKMKARAGAAVRKRFPGNGK